MSSLNGKTESDGYWCSLDQLADTPEYRQYLESEMTDRSDGASDSLSRRKFMKLMGAAMALAGLAGCRRPVEKIVPYLSMPEEVVLGVPNYYATTMPLGLDVCGLVVECHEGRPTKTEGNPLHPTTPAGSSAFMQAAILGLYDPDRSRNVLHQGAVSSWAKFVEFWRGLEPEYLSSRGEGLAVLTESFSSPTLARLKDEFSRRFPNASWATYEPVSDENIYKGIEAATGQPLRPVFHFDKADVILSLDCDFLGMESGSVRHAHDFASRRKVGSPEDTMNRLYAAESIYSLTGAMADHRVAAKSFLIFFLASSLAKSLGVRVGGIESPPLEKGDLGGFQHLVTKNLLFSPGKSLIVAGRR